jgi:hypothetical protein
MRDFEKLELPQSSNILVQTSINYSKRGVTHQQFMKALKPSSNPIKRTVKEPTRRELAMLKKPAPEI